MAQIQFSLIEKIKIGCPEHSLTPYSPPSDNIPSHFYLTPPPPSPLALLKVNVICVSPLINLNGLPLPTIAWEYLKTEFELCLNFWRNQTFLRLCKWFYLSAYIRLFSYTGSLRKKTILQENHFFLPEPQFS